MNESESQGQSSTIEERVQASEEATKYIKKRIADKDFNRDDCHDVAVMYYAYTNENMSNRIAFAKEKATFPLPDVDLSEVKQESEALEEELNPQREVFSRIIKRASEGDYSFMSGRLLLIGRRLKDKKDSEEQKLGLGMEELGLMLRHYRRHDPFQLPRPAIEDPDFNDRLKDPKSTDLPPAPETPNI